MYLVTESDLKKLNSKQLLTTTHKLPQDQKILIDGMKRQAKRHTYKRLVPKFVRYL